MHALGLKSSRLVLAGLLAALGLSGASGACTATGGLDRYTLGLDPAVTCTDPKALKRVLAIDLAQIAKAGDVLALGGGLPLATEYQYRYLRPQPIRGLRLDGIANRMGEQDSLALAFNEPLAFLRPLYERAGWRLHCQRDSEGERCLAQREIRAADGQLQATSIELVQPSTPSPTLRSYVVCSMPGLMRLD